MSLHLGAFVLSNIERIKNNFEEAISGFKTNDGYCGDSDSIYIEKRHRKN